MRTLLHREQAVLDDISVVTFDLWQTLILDRRELGLARTQIRLEGTRDALIRFGEDYDLEHIREAYKSCYRQCQLIRNEDLDVSFREQVGMFINNISPELVDRLDLDTVEEIVRVYADSFLAHPPTVHVDALTVLRDLKAMGLHLALISNTGMTPGATFRDFMESQGILAYFDALTFSDEVKLAKPSKEMFLMTLRSMGATPGQAVHVGDHLVNDVVGAKRCGLKTVWIPGFYDGERPTGPESVPDATVASLGLVVPAIAEMAGMRVPS